jgi:hypothetical protein
MAARAWAGGLSFGGGLYGRGITMGGVRGDMAAGQDKRVLAGRSAVGE